MPSESFRDVPELFESKLEESLEARTSATSKVNQESPSFTQYLGTFKQLGPADLVHVVKIIPNSRQHVKEVNKADLFTYS